MTDKKVVGCLKYFLIKIQCREFILLPPSERGLLIDTLEDAIALINCQQAEIERLQKEVDALTQQIMKPFHEEREKWIELEKEFTTKAIKEFWGKLKSHSRKMQSSDFSGEFWDRAVLVEDGDNLLKEMVGEDK